MTAQAQAQCRQRSSSPEAIRTVGRRGTSYWSRREIEIGDWEIFPMAIASNPYPPRSVRCAYMTKTWIAALSGPSSLSSDWFKGPENLLRNLHVGRCHDPCLLCPARQRAGSTPRRWTSRQGARCKGSEQDQDWLPSLWTLANSSADPDISWPQDILINGNVSVKNTVMETVRPGLFLLDCDVPTQTYGYSLVNYSLQLIVFVLFPLLASISPQ